MSSVKDWDDTKNEHWAEMDAQEFAKEMAEVRVELMAKAASGYDGWDWDKLYKHEKDRYRGIILAALKAVEE